MRTSDSLTIGRNYSRQQLREMFDISDATINTGIFRPEGHNSVWLFVTEKKTADRVQYRDSLRGDDLEWEGQLSGRKDGMIAGHSNDGLELLVFYRRRKDELPNYAFRYLGPFQYVSHRPGSPTRFLLRRTT